MANNSQKNNKGLLIGICAAVVVIIVVVVAIVLATTGSPKLDDAYFKSDDTKYVLTMGPDEMSTTYTEYMPEQTHLVYYYSGDKITNLKAYYEYEDEATAKEALDFLNSDENESKDWKSIARDGKYVIIEAEPKEYESMTAEQAKEQIEFMESLKNLDFNDSSTDDDETVDIIETDDVVEE